MKTALLFGASGLVGGHLLSTLLRHSAYQQVIAVVRRELPLRHPQLKLIGDSANPHRRPRRRRRICLSPSAPRAKTAQTRGTTTVSITTIRCWRRGGRLSMARAQSCWCHRRGPASARTRPNLRVKGEVERDIIALHAARTHVFRPGMILGEKREHRPLEKGLNRVWPRLNFVLRGRAQKHRAITAADIAVAMVAAAQLPTGEVNIYTCSEMQALVQDAGGYHAGSAGR
ncbi:MAG: hypothetical protein ACR5LG_06750 [Sodalis sp. (in: enterobacteria)]|uniref:hypothetical protein n=1 Tax=Sodalis sp. (in: enterobacteria) TaxID=1898979 RepID=UPI003F2F3F5D